MSYRVLWGENKSIELKTREAAVLLAKSFREEGQTATAYVRTGSDWVEI